MVGNDRQAVFPDQLLQAGHFVRFTAEVDLHVDDTTPIEILTQRPTVRATISGEDQYGVERDHPIRPPRTN